MRLRVGPADRQCTTAFDCNNNRILSLPCPAQESSSSMENEPAWLPTTETRASGSPLARGRTEQLLTSPALRRPPSHNCLPRLCVTIPPAYTVSRTYEQTKASPKVVNALHSSPSLPSAPVVALPRLAAGWSHVDVWRGARTIARAPDSISTVVLLAL